MSLPLLVVAGIIGWAGATLILDARRRRRRPHLVDRLRPFQPQSVGDQAERWLDEQEGERP